MAVEDLAITAQRQHNIGHRYLVLRAGQYLVLDVDIRLPDVVDISMIERHDVIADVTAVRVSQA